MCKRMILINARLGYYTRYSCNIYFNEFTIFISDYIKKISLDFAQDYFNLCVNSLCELSYTSDK